MASDLVGTVRPRTTAQAKFSEANAHHVDSKMHMALPSVAVRALLVDDEPGIRKVIARMLSGRMGVHVVECEDGIGALAALTTDHYSFAIVDLDMPRLDGIQVLQAIRESPSLSQLPVVIVTGHSEDATVRRVSNMGVSGYMVKPILPGELQERLGGLIARIREQEAATVRSSAQGFQPLELTPDTPVLVVDGSAEFRQFFSKTVGHLCSVEETGTGLEAIAACEGAMQPYAIFIGSDLGVMKGEMLARNLASSGIRIIGIQPPRLGMRPKKASPYDALIVRSFIPEVFTEGFNSLLLRGGPVSGLRATIPDINLLGIAAAEEALSTMLRHPLVLKPAHAKVSAVRSWVATLMLEAGPAAVPLRIRLSTAERCLAKVSKRLLASGMKECAHSEDSLVPMVERIGELLGRELEGRGIAVRQNAPATIRGLSRKEQLEQEREAEVVLAFDVQRAGIAFRLEISSGADAATSPCQSPDADTVNAAVDAL